MKFIFLDLETTGLLPYRCGIHQCGAISTQPGKPYLAASWDIAPYPDCQQDKRALELTTKTHAQLAAGLPETEFFSQLQQYLARTVNRFDSRDKALLIGYNIKFDEEFLRALWKRHNDNFFGSWFHWPSIDVGQMAALALGPSRPSNMKLSTIYQHVFRKPLADAHDAMADIKATMELFFHFAQTNYPELVAPYKA